MEVRSEKELSVLPKKDLVGLVHKYEQELRYLRRQHFGSTSKRLVPVPNGQIELGLFNEAEKLIEIDPPQWDDDEDIVVDGKSPKAYNRQTLFEAARMIGIGKGSALLNCPDSNGKEE